MRRTNEAMVMLGIVTLVSIVYLGSAIHAAQSASTRIATITVATIDR